MLKLKIQFLFYMYSSEHFMQITIVQVVFLLSIVITVIQCYICPHDTICSYRLSVL